MDAEKERHVAEEGLDSLNFALRNTARLSRATLGRWYNGLDPNTTFLKAEGLYEWEGIELICTAGPLHALPHAIPMDPHHHQFLGQCRDCGWKEEGKKDPIYSLV